MERAVRLGKGGQGAVYLLPCKEGDEDGKRTAIKVGRIDFGHQIEQASKLQY
jgi:hypothetical protein